LIDTFLDLVDGTAVSPVIGRGAETVAAIGPEIMTLEATDSADQTVTIHPSVTLMTRTRTGTETETSGGGIGVLLRVVARVVHVVK
jgi:hypothetical protein